jgi:hypothetical protein
MQEFLTNFVLVFITSYISGRAEYQWHHGSPYKVFWMTLATGVVSAYASWQVFVNRSIPAAAGSALAFSLAMAYTSHLFKRDRDANENKSDG